MGPLMPTTRETLDPAREAALIAEALCTCSQSYGRHAQKCITSDLTRSIHGRLTDALTAHDRRLLAASEEFCSSCGEAVDPDNLCRVNGVTYHLGNCPRPHGATYDDAWHEALTIDCPRCHAVPGELCRDVPEGSDPQIHLRRIEATTAYGAGSGTALPQVTPDVQEPTP